MEPQLFGSAPGSPALMPSRAGCHQYQLRSEEHTSELQSRQYLVCRLLLEKKKKEIIQAAKRHECAELEPKARMRDVGGQHVRQPVTTTTRWQAPAIQPLREPTSAFDCLST